MCPIDKFIQTRHLPHHKYKRTHLTTLDDEDVSQDIQIELGEKLKNGSIKATNLVEVIASPKMQDRFELVGIEKPSISEHMAHRWLGRLGWRYGRQQNSMYIDGHEHEDIIQCRNAFIQCFKQYEQHFHLWDDNGNELPKPSGFPVPGTRGHFWLILITHDELTFFQNNQQNLLGSQRVKQDSKTKGGGPVPHGFGLPDHRLGSFVWWRQVRPLLHLFIDCSHLLQQHSCHFQAWEEQRRLVLCRQSSWPGGSQNRCFQRSHQRMGTRPFPFH